MTTVGELVMPNAVKHNMQWLPLQAVFLVRGENKVSCGHDKALPRASGFSVIPPEKTVKLPLGVPGQSLGGDGSGKPHGPGRVAKKPTLPTPISKLSLCAKRTRKGEVRMAKLGKMTKGGANDFRGVLNLVHADLPFVVVPDKDAGASDSAPTHEINVTRSGGGEFNIGSVWTMEIGRGENQGKKAYSILIDHPEFPGIRASAFPINDREFLIRTDRPRQAGEAG